ncbi:MAG: SpoIIE family protein phosphatase [Peptococcaceae bacterium]|jgi:negative regulator of sigma-B (phosphoserine phosphatase)|nr:SpoIIE family protein phosphatase [Peptococcaceae bacterium]
MPVRPLDLGVAVRKLPHEAESGDLYFFQQLPDSILLAVIDGLGHGPEAALAARAAARILATFPEKPVKSLFELCHEELKKTRGVVMTLAAFNTTRKTMTWLGVGNVEAVLLSANPALKPASKSLLLRPGIIGYQIPHLSESVVPVSIGDTLILATDGINFNFVPEINVHNPTQQIADQILAGYCKGYDDAMVLVARYQEG